LLDDDTANASIQTVVSGNAPFTGTFKPNSPLSVYKGLDPNGTWNFQAQDFFSGDTGNIRAYSLIITPTSCATTACGVTCPANMTVTASGPGGAVVNYPEATVTGGCGVLKYSTPSGATFPVGTTGVTVTGAGGATCSFNVTVNPPVPPPANDDCANAIAVTPANCGFTDTQNTVNATDQVGEPGSSCTSQGNSVWYSYTNTTANDILVTVSTCTSDFDTAIQVWEQTGAACDFNTFVAVACNDDACGDGFQSSTSFIAGPGKTYKIQSGGFDGETGNLTTNISCEVFTCPTTTIHGTLGSGSPDHAFTTGNQTGRLNRNGISSSCATPKSCNIFTATGSRAYDAYTFPNTSGDFSQLLVKAGQLKPQILGVMQAGGDLVNVVKQYNQFKLGDQGIKLAIGLLFDTDITAIGQDQMAGVVYTTPWVWSMDDQAKQFADKFLKRTGIRPTFAHAGNYSAAWQYMEAIRRAGTDDADAVVKQLEGYKFNDFFIRNGNIRAEDHWVMHDALLAQVKPASQATEKFDYSKVLATIPADTASRPLADAPCKK